MPIDHRSLKKTAGSTSCPWAIILVIIYALARQYRLVSFPLIFKPLEGLQVLQQKRFKRQKGISSRYIPKTYFLKLRFIYTLTSITVLVTQDMPKYFSGYSKISISRYASGGRVVRWCWVNFQCRGVLLIWIGVGQGPTALAVGAAGGCFWTFFLSSIIFFFSFSLCLGDGPI